MSTPEACLHPLPLLGSNAWTPCVVHQEERHSAFPKLVGGERRIAVLTEVATGSYLIGMRAVGLKILKNKLSEYIRLAASGETVLVTDRDAVVAEIGPPRLERSPMLADAQLAEAVRKGWITPPTLASDAPAPRKPVMPLRELAREIEADRADR